MNLYLWGCGERCKYFLEYNYIKQEDIKGFIDSNINLNQFYERKVYRPDQLDAFVGEADYILVTTKEEHANRQILERMKELSYPMDKVLFIYNDFPMIRRQRIHEQDENIFRNISEKLYFELKNREKNMVEDFNVSYKCDYDRVDLNSVLLKYAFGEETYHVDYTRYRTFELVANEIEKNQIPGAVAEFGVFKGSFSRLINAHFQNRNLYLFDSFESFQKDEYTDECVESDMKQERDMMRNAFTNTSVEFVLKRMPYPQNCIIRRGYFPDSIEEEDKKETFAFVSLDVDLEQPTYAGLKFFYPRLVTNGYLFIHDYNNRMWNGVKAAVEKYEKEQGITLKKVPVCDRSGTVIIVK